MTRLSACPLIMTKHSTSINDSLARSRRDLLLVFVAYHPSQPEVVNLMNCLASLSDNIGYAIVVNEYLNGEPVESLFANADYISTNTKNIGYGAAANSLIFKLGLLPPYVSVLNTDITWDPGTFERLLKSMQDNPDVALATPAIIDKDGIVQKLCKHSPTVLALLSRRFIGSKVKPIWLRRYDNWYIMGEFNYSEVIQSNYLSGCCMLFKSEAFVNANGFDPRFFLYLEDADITLRMKEYGRCIHLPVACITHGWGRGNYTSFKLTLVSIFSTWKYFLKWGLKLW